MDGDTVIIRSKRELKKLFEEEKANIFGDKPVDFETKYRSSFRYMYYKYILALREYEFLCYKRDNTKGLSSRIIAQKVKKADRRKNRLSLKIGVDFSAGMVEKSVTVCHPNVILNGRVGEGCVFHGNNVLGNKKTGAADMIPTLGKNVDVGVGAIIIGNVEIADNCVIGAGAVVTKSFTDPGSVIVGNPARRIK